MHYHFHKFISKKREIEVVDRLMSIAAVIHPLSATPQIYSIYTTQDATGVSLWTWLGFMLIGLIFLAYGLLHKIKPFIVTQTLWFVVDFIIVAGILLYGAK